MPLTEAQIKAATPKKSLYYLPDGDALRLLIKPSGAKLWRYSYRIGSRQKTAALGQWPAVKLRDARRLRDEARKQVQQGIDPCLAKRQAKQAQEIDQARTLRSVAELWLHKTEKRRSTRTHRDVVARLERYALSRVGDLPVSAIDTATVLRIVDRAERRAPSQARALLHDLSGVMGYAAVRGMVPANPASGLSREVIVPARQHHRALPASELGDLLRALDRYEGVGGRVLVKSALTLVIYTALRSSEVCGGEWSEIDLDAGVWAIPAARMKSRRPHTCYLSSQAVAVLRELHEITGGDRWIFPASGRQSGHTAPAALRKGLSRLGTDATVHGFRSLFSTTANEVGWRSDWVEACLAHLSGDAVRRSYCHAEWVAGRQQLMQWWGDYCDAARSGRSLPQTGQVIPIRKTS